VNPAERALSRLRRLPGVVVGFACSARGQLLGASTPATSGSPALAQTAQRLLGLLQAARDAVPDCRRLTLGWEEHRLEVLALEHGLVCALTARDVDLAALEVELLASGNRLFNGAA
jgi:Arc/MetJ family transcription regulator